MPLADQLTVARAASVVLVIALFQWDFENHLYWATAVFAAAMATDQIDGWLARRQGHTSALGSMLDPVADKVLVLAMLIMVVGAGAFPAWMVALIVAREFLVSGLRLAAIERGVVIPARDLSKLKTGRRRLPQRSAAWPPPARGATTSPGGRCSSRSCSRSCPASSTRARHRGCSEGRRRASRRGPRWTRARRLATTGTPRSDCRAAKRQLPRSPRALPATAPV